MNALKLFTSRFSYPAPIVLELRRDRLTPSSQLAVIVMMSLVATYVLYCYGSITKETLLQREKIERDQQRTKLSTEPLKLAPVEEATLQKTLKVLDHPWQIPFQIIEFANIENVTLMEVRTEIEKRETKISAQTTDLTSMFSYAKQLKKAANVRRVTLNSEEIQDDDIQPISFTLTVSW